MKGHENVIRTNQKPNFFEVLVIAWVLNHKGFISHADNLSILSLAFPLYIPSRHFFLR